MKTAIFDALGQSIAYEDYKGNFARARSIAEQWVTERREAGDAGGLAKAFLWRAIVHILQAELNEAAACLDEAEQRAPDDANLLLRAASYHMLITYERFNTFPDGSGAGAIEITARWRGAEDMRDADARWHDLLRRASDPQAQTEAWLVYAFLCNLKPARFALERSRFAPPAASRAEMLQMVLATPARVQQTAHAGGLSPLAAYADWCAADLSRRAGDSQSARHLLDRAQQTYQQANDPAGVALCLTTRADWQCAPFSTPVAWNFALQDSSSEGSNLAVSLESEEFALPPPAAVVHAREAYAEAARLFAQASAARGTAAVQLRFGYLAMLEDDYHAAARFAELAHAGFDACGDARGSAQAQAHLAMSRIGTGRPTESLDLARAIGTRGAHSGCFSFTLGLGVLLNRLARHWLIRRGDYERALAGHNAAKALFEAMGATTNAAQTIVDQGVVYQAVGDRASALTMYEQALDLYTHDADGRPGLRDNLLQRLILLGSSVYRLYLQQMDADGMERSAARLKTHIAHLPHGSEIEGDAGTSLPVGLEWWALRQLAQSNIEMAAVLARVYRSRQSRDAGDDLLAEQLLAEAVSALANVREGQRHFLESTVRAEQQRFDEAAAALGRHLRLGGANAGFTGRLTDLMTTVGGERGLAEAWLQQRRTHEQAFSAFVGVKAYAEAKTHLEALEQREGPDWWARDEKPWQPLADCAELYEGLGDLQTALACYDRAITQLEARRSQLSRDELKTALAADRGVQYLYLRAARATMNLGDHVRAFDYAERGRARALLDLMAGSASGAGAPAAEGEYPRAWRQLNAQLTLWRGLLAHARAAAQPDAARIGQLAQQIEADESRLRTVEAELARAFPDFYEAVSADARTLSVDQIAAALPADTLLVAYFFMDDDLLVWGIHGGGLAHAHGLSIDGRAFTRAVRAFHRACARRDVLEPVGSQLAEMLLGPVASSLRTHSRVIFVPYGIAHTLPFHALPFDGEPLGIARMVSYLPSASVLQFLRLDGQRAPILRMLAVGNPRNDLPAAATEAAFVASVFGERALLGDEATEPVVRDRMTDCSLLHFATHGFLSEDAPLASSIALAGDDELTVYELMGMRLNADLIVLSGCNTGQGTATGGDDVVGLTRGLLGTGARAALVSLWEVNDVSTSILMGEFYRRLQAGDTASAALRAAQRHVRALKPSEIVRELDRLYEDLETADVEAEALRAVSDARSVRSGVTQGPSALPKHYGHPYFWAPFILVG